MPPIRLGALCWNQYSDWPSLLEAGRRAGPLRGRHPPAGGPPPPLRGPLGGPRSRAGPPRLGGARRADRLGFDTLWTWDHLYPIVGSWEGPILEGYTVLTGWAMATEQIRLGLMVGANTFREPTLTAKIATTLDHVSGGRAILGIGAAWFDRAPRLVRAFARSGVWQRVSGRGRQRSLV